ncbi:MAG: hypothetical protein IKD73_05130 [Selenomonadaceae bacterium]|nr:hypothetical protein [Selenomonadaceae bacterium]
MFYQTQVKSIIQGGVIDVHGKELSIIGNKLVKKGDFVWTDGKVVFGHTPIANFLDSARRLLYITLNEI